MNGSARRRASPRTSSRRLQLTPTTLRAANAFIAEHHRHHRPARGCISVVACREGERVCGVAVVGRPVARQDGHTAEVTRCCTDGTPNACSMLYRAAWRSVKALGYRRLVTYTLPEEGGCSLRAAGFTLAGEAGGGSWSRPQNGRPRQDEHPVEKKLRWEITTGSSPATTQKLRVGHAGATGPDELITRAREEHRPVAVWCLFSGGNDSTVLAHRCREHYQGLAWIDTGTAVPGVAEFVHEYAAWVGKPLRVLRAGDAYRQMVLGDLVWWARFIAGHDREPGLTVDQFMDRDRARHGRVSGRELGQPPHGFPGPASHGTSYWRLKGRALEALLRESKRGHPRSARVLFLSGVRRAESRRRAQRNAIERAPGKAMVFVNPLIDWSDEKMRRYRAEHQVPESPAAALLHRSGECNCGAFAKAGGEREMLKALYPEFFAGIEALEARAEAAGLRWCRWGGYDIHGNRAGEASKERPGLLCESCESRHHARFADGWRKPAGAPKSIAGRRRS